MKKILFLSHQGIGDLLLSLPIYDSIRERYPDAVITSTVKGAVEKDILKNQFRSHKFIMSNYHKMSLIKKLSWLSRFFFSRYDIIVAPVGSNIKYAIILRILSLSRRLIAPLNNGSISIFVSDPVYVSEKAKRLYNNQKIASFFHNTDSVPSLKIKQNVKILNNYTLKRQVFGIHPGSGEIEKHKRWPLEHYAKLINMLVADSSTTIFLFGVESEIEICNSIMKKIENTENVHSVCGSTTFDESLSIVKECNFFISADSGMMHAAAALNVRTISIFGPTSHAEIAPYWNDSIIISNDLSCSPCYPYFLQGCGDTRCMFGITPEYVYQVLKDNQKVIKKKNMAD